MQPKEREQKPPVSAAAGKSKGPQDGLRTPLLLRNALSSGLARVLSGRGLSTPAPAVTVMEASPLLLFAVWRYKTRTLCNNSLSWN